MGRLAGKPRPRWCGRSKEEILQSLRHSHSPIPRWIFESLNKRRTQISLDDANKIIAATLEEVGWTEKVKEMPMKEACEFYGRIYHAAGLIK